jgi:hypothetical protein
MIVKAFLHKIRPKVPLNKTLLYGNFLQKYQIIYHHNKKMDESEKTKNEQSE